MRLKDHKSTYHIEGFIKNIKMIIKNIELLMLRNILLFFLLYSCNNKPLVPSVQKYQETNKSNTELLKNEIEQKQFKIAKDIDEVVIKYWDNYYANTFVFKLLSYKEEVIITYEGEILFKEKKTLSDLNKKHTLIKYINQFYIDKSSEIIINTKNEEELVADYPFVRVIGIKNEVQVFNTYTIIKDNIEYHSEFIEFYELLREISQSSVN